MAKFEKHIFICGNQRPPDHPRGCCDPAAKAELQKLFKQKLAERGLKGKVRANQSGCLDQCEHGPNIVVYPEAVWYGRVTEADVDEIIDSHIVSGKAVERLMLAADRVYTPTCEHRTPREYRAPGRHRKGRMRYLGRRSQTPERIAMVNVNGTIGSAKRHLDGR